MDVSRGTVEELVTMMKVTWVSSWKNIRSVFISNPDDSNKKTVIFKPLCTFSISQYGHQWYHCPNTSSKSAALLFLTPFQLLLGGLLGEGEPCQLALHPWLTHKQWNSCPWMVKKPWQLWLWLPCTFSVALFYLLVKQFDHPLGRLLWELQILWRVAWTVLLDTSWAWVKFLTLSHGSFSTSAVGISDRSLCAEVPRICQRRFPLLCLLMITKICFLVKALSP